LLEDFPLWINRHGFVIFDSEENSPPLRVLLHDFFDKNAPLSFSTIGEIIDNPYIAGHSSLLVLSHLPDPKKGLRLVSLIQEEDIGVQSSKENLYLGDYPLRMQLLLVVNRSEGPKA